MNFKISSVLYKINKAALRTMRKAAFSDLSRECLKFCVNRKYQEEAEVVAAFSYILND